MITAEAGRVGLVVVSHSVAIGVGVVEFASQMAPSVRIVAAGGTDDGGIGTSFDLVLQAIVGADAGRGAVVLCDLGSAVLTAESSVEFLDAEQRTRVRIADAPLVEGAVSAAVSAEIGDDVDAVAAAATGAWGRHPTTDTESRPRLNGEAYARTAVLENSDGLHARPAMELVKLASTFPACVTANGRNAKSLLEMLSLGLKRGETVEISSNDAQAVDAVVALVVSRFNKT